MDTIFALASARGKAGVSVIRISGERAVEVAGLLCGSLPEPRVAAVRSLRFGGELLDEALVIWFPKGASFTGEAVVELHVHGAVATVTAVLRALGETEARLAEPGEFTRRAMENGRLDLAQVEGLADLIDAETEAQRKQALKILSGAVGHLVGQWRSDLIRAAALLEATIDFADEDVPVDVMPEVTELVTRVRDAVQAEVAKISSSERIREGFEVAIVGEPNAGKSTLLNALAGREAAITSDVAGTTRDVIEVRMEIGGFAVTLLDTAGLRETEDQVEQIGISRALQRARDADFRLFLLGEGDVPMLEPEPDDLVVWGKSDARAVEGLAISGRTGAGLEKLLETLAERLAQRVGSSGVLTRERHRQALGDAVAHLSAVLESSAYGMVEAEILAAEVRLATRSLEMILGKVDVEDLLGEIFSSFCIGK